MTTPRRKRQSTAAPAPALAALPPVWSERQAEAHLRSLELFGMRFGLDRMRRMMTVLGAPQSRYETVHVLGTNGKTSTTRMTAAILERHGLSTAAYTSPHLISYTERVQVGERDIAEAQLAAAIARAAWAAERVNRTLAADDHVTQFELLTAAALWAMAERGVDVAVIEAGLGGRYDATSVIDSRVTVLTNVGLEHTRWLGPTVRDIAEEKLAVLGEGSALALGAGLAPEALAVAERVARERGARIATAPAEPSVPASLLAAKGEFQRRNFALAELAARTYLRSVGVTASEQAIRDAALATDVRGRLQVIDEDPLTVLDGAHNPDAVRALVRALPELLGERPLALVLGVLDDKDAAAMLEALLPLCERAWFTAPPSERALSPAALQSLARQLGFDRVSCEASPARALGDAREWAARHGAAVLATGSVYLVGDLLEQREDRAETEESGARRRRAAT
ncbi:MAG TPA: folylpolyglutamate synthase/dihydrofolate synthase family protein [Solirubrobacteraceae bacterium]|nr:folylpolyglutamate synthase/dihydrofolate synthase family protein [Solirubrobacteraceae bacterium]